MNWDRIAGNWEQFKGTIREKWGQLTDDDVEQIAGKKDQLIGKLRKRKGIAVEAAEQEVREWLQSLRA